MKIRCAWHKKTFGYELITGEKPPYGDHSTTDGICDDCLLRNFPTIYEKTAAIRDKEER